MSRELQTRAYEIANERLREGPLQYGDELLALLDRIVPEIERLARADERARIAEELRELVATQGGWLWFEVGESALEKVAAHIAPRPDTPPDDRGLTS